MAATPALVVASQLLRLPGDALDDAIRRELADNPAFEAHERRALESVGAPHSRRVHEHDLDAAEHVRARETPIDHLIAQARMIASGADLDIAIYLLHSLDEHGYLTAGLDESAHALGTTRAQVEQAVAILRVLHPPGIGARDARECLSIQCNRLSADIPAGSSASTACENVRLILSSCWDDFLHQRDERVARKLCIAVTDVAAARHFMRKHLHPYPLQLVDGASGEIITLTHADLVIRRVEAAEGIRFAVEVPAAERYEVRVCREFERALRDSNQNRMLEFEQRQWVLQYVDRARLFIEALDHRWGTLRRLGEYLATHQAEFFERGPRHLKPLTRSAVAVALSVHESTISRAVSDKTIQLPSGRLMPLSDLFDASAAPKEAIRQLVTSGTGAETPRRTWSDQEIAARLEEQGIRLARRTVAKYRQQLGLPARLRGRAATASKAKENR